MMSRPAPAPEPIALRPARPEDFAFCQRISHETMRWIIERLFGWDKRRQVEKFASQWQLDETRIIKVAGEDAGWLQTKPTDDAIFLGQLYLDGRFQGGQNACPPGCGCSHPEPPDHQPGLRFRKSSGV